MKKRISAIFTALLLSLALCIPTSALNGIMDYMIDSDDLLTYEEWETLEEQAAEISRRHGIGVYVQFVYDYTSFDYGDVYETAEAFYHEDGFGEGEGLDGILLLVSQYTRDYALYHYGESAGAVFTAECIDALEECFLPFFGENDWCGGFDAYLVACDEYLTEGPPAQEIMPTEEITPTEEISPEQGSAQSEPLQESPIGGILKAVVISCAVALIVCLVLKGKMKSVSRKTEAKNYVTFGGLELTERYDRFTHTTESRCRIEKKESNQKSGGNGGGSSGKF